MQKGMFTIKLIFQQTFPLFNILYFLVVTIELLLDGNMLCTHEGKCSLCNQMPFKYQITEIVPYVRTSF